MIANAAYPAINVLVDEWLYGIQLPHGRTPPLRDLEHAALLQPTTSYRWGSAMAKAVQLRKAIIYDVLRRASILCPNAPLTDVTQPGSGARVHPPPPPPPPRRGCCNMRPVSA